MSTPVLNNGLFVRDTMIEVSSDVSDRHLLTMAGNRTPTDLGVIELFQQTKMVDMPLYSMSSFQKEDIIEVDDPEGRYTWRHPIAEDLPHSMGDLDPSNTMKGRDEVPFKMQLNKRQYGPGDVITYDKMTGVEVYIVARDVTHAQGYAIYTVTTVSGQILDNKFLEHGVKWFSVTSSKSMEGQEFSKMMARAKYRNFFNYVGNSNANASYTVSSRAELLAKGGLTVAKDGSAFMPSTEIWNISNDPKWDPSIRNINEFATLVGKDYMKDSMNAGTITRSYITNLELTHVRKVANDIESYMMWGKGGRIGSEEGSPHEQRLSVGLWKQTDNSFKHIYNFEDFTLDMFNSELFNFYNGRVSFDGPDSKNELIVQTGLGGMELVSKAIENRAFGNGRLDIDAERIGAIEGKSMELSYGVAFTRFKFPFLANVRFTINPALDPVEANDIENPRIPQTGKRLSSYSFIIFDITDMKSGNIKMLKRKDDPGLMWRYRNGNMDYKGNTSGFLSVGKFDGYEVDMEQMHRTIFIEDPTRMLKFVMRNPITGGSM